MRRAGTRAELGKARVRPAALLGWGYEFADPTVADVVASGLDAA